MIMNAEQVISKYWNQTIPVNPMAIANNMGVAVQSAPYLGTESGHYLPNGAVNQGPLILYNPNEALVRQRFTVAHELGHHVYGHGDSPRDNFSTFNMGASYNEVLANKFAAELLMPEEFVHALIQVRGMTNLKDLAEAFLVSKAAMTYRAMNLGYNIS